MRVAFLTTEYPTGRFFAGGQASYLWRSTRALVEAGLEAEVFAVNPDEGTTNDEGVLIHAVAGRSPAPAWLANKPFIWRWSEAARVGGSAWNLYAAFQRRHRDRPFDIIQASNLQACGIVAAVRTSIPVITRLSAFEPLCREGYGKPLSRYQRAREKAELWQIRRSTAVYAPSQLIAERASRAAKRRVEVIEPPFSIERPDLTHSTLPAGLPADSYGLFFGSLGILKGTDRLVRVLPDLLRRLPEMKFVLAGPVREAPQGGPFDAWARHELAEWKDRVFILREQPRETLLPLVAAARFVVLPSRIDNLPNSCLEAMALERVVIGTHGASFDQLIDDGLSGFLVSQDDERELAATMERAWRLGDGEREMMGRNAAAVIARMAPHLSIPRLVSYFEEVIGGKRRRRVHREPASR